MVCASSPEGTESNSADLNKPQHKISTAAVLQHWEASPPSIFLTGNVMVPEIHPAVLYYAAVSNRKGKEHNSPLFCTWVTVQCLGGRAHNIPFIHPPHLKAVPGIICAMQGGAVWKQLWDMFGCRGLKGFPPWHHNPLCCTCTRALDRANWSQQPSLLSHTVHPRYQKSNQLRTHSAALFRLHASEILTDLPPRGKRRKKME